MSTANVRIIRHDPNEPEVSANDSVYIISIFIQEFQGNITNDSPRIKKRYIIHVDNSGSEYLIISINI